MQRKWSKFLTTEESDLLQRAFLIFLGEARVGKTALEVSLRDQAFKHTESTAGIATRTLDATDVENWCEIRITGLEQVIGCTL